MKGKTMWIIAILVLVAAALAYVILRGRKPPSPPQDTYVCDVCNERECICHKQEEKP
jgi:hypothetical protein